MIFGLSIDYHVFMISRIREHFVEPVDNTESVAFGLQSTGRLITSVALVMMAVFAGFAGGIRTIGEVKGSLTVFSIQPNSPRLHQEHKAASLIRLF